METAAPPSLDFNSLFNYFIQNQLVGFSAKYLMILMLFLWLGSLVMRYLVYFTIARHEWFAAEFEKRVRRFLDRRWKNPIKADLSFYVLAKRILETTYYEVFETRAKLRRRKSDPIMEMSDRLYLIKPGTAYIIKDILYQLRILKFGDDPHLLQITKNTFQKNPFFNKVIGVIPAAGMNDFLNLLPGLFVIGGIFGTFLGIMQGLPMLSQMDLSDVEKTKQTMDHFVTSIALAMNTSIVGIVFSVTLSLMNTTFSPEKLFVTMIDRFENSLNLLWNVCANNDIPMELPEFNEHRDPREALAEQAIDSVLEKHTRHRDSTLSAGAEEPKKVS
jgi:hypothetical protein